MRQKVKNDFNRGIEKILELLDFEFYIVYLDKNVSCTCLMEGTSQPDPNCEKCLGTGHKIKIRKVHGALQESDVPTTMKPNNNFLITRNYYVKSKVEIENDDLIIDEYGAWQVYQKKDHFSFDGELVFQKCTAVPKRMDQKTFVSNFNKLIGKK